VTPVLRCEVPLRHPVAVLVAAGMLRLDSAAVLRTAALKVLADRPTALVLDLAGVDVVEPAAATVLPLIDQYAAVRAEVPLLIAAPPPPVRTALRRLGVTVPVYDTRAAALTAAATRPVPSRVRLAFDVDLGAPAAARRTVRLACERWDLGPALAERAAQVANELVSNVVQHAGTGGTVLLTRRPAHLHLAVRDGSRAPPVAGAGYGLALVAGLTSTWGVRDAPDGKVVWATLRIWPRGRGPDET
jgi:anti-anti-sigma regulatory factor